VKFWLQVLIELKNRGLADVRITVCGYKSTADDQRQDDLAALDEYPETHEKAAKKPARTTGSGTTPTHEAPVIADFRLCTQAASRVETASAWKWKA